MNKSLELQYIDQFIETFNRIFPQHYLSRASDQQQEKPDAVAILDQNILIGIETTFVMRKVDTPHISIAQIEEALATDTRQASDYIRERIKIKNYKLNSLYKPENPKIQAFWLLLIGASMISITDLQQDLAVAPIPTDFQRIFIYKGLFGQAQLVEFSA